MHHPDRHPPARRAGPARAVGFVLAVALAVALLVLAGAGTAGADPTGPDPTGPERYYVSLGDSYAAGYQPAHDGRPAGPGVLGFADRLVTAYARTGVRLTLANFGCVGATARALLQAIGCAPAARAVGGPDYGGQSQAAAARAFLLAHRDRIALVTVVIGGNDVNPCLVTDAGTLRPDAATCLARVVPTLGTQLATVLAAVREAAGPTVPVVGLSYIDVLLGAWLAPDRGGPQLAAASVTAFRDQVNPVLRGVYQHYGAGFVDVTAASGGYRPLTATTDTPYGPLPEAVARACALTFYCELGDPHPRPPGHDLIAEAVRAAVPSP